MIRSVDPKPYRARAALVALSAMLVLAGSGAALAQDAPVPEAMSADGEEAAAEAGAPAVPPPEAPPLGPSGRPLPRFVSLGSDHINMRTGPGTRYPVTWVYKRRGLPLEVVRETNDWRQVRDPEGAEGWVHKMMLSNSRRMALVVGDTPHMLLRRPDPGAEAVARVEPGVLVKLLQCPRDSAHCRVEAARFQGWLPREALWGVYPGEDVD